jgi:hypothetical protein
LHEPPDLCTLYIIDRPWRNLADVWTFISTCGLCIISNSLARTTRLVHLILYRPALEKISRRVDLYKYLWSLYNIKQPCTNHRTCAPYTLSTGLAETLWNNIMGPYNVGSSLSNIHRACQIYRTCGLYKVWPPLHNVDRPYKY